MGITSFATTLFCFNPETFRIQLKSEEKILYFGDTALLQRTPERYEKVDGGKMYWKRKIPE
jgi:hypothetical protein